MPIVSGPNQGSEKTAPYAIGVRITDEGAELFHTGIYVGDDPVLKATFAGPEVVVLPNREAYSPLHQATMEAYLHAAYGDISKAAFDESIDTDWPARSFGLPNLLHNLN